MVKLPAAVIFCVIHLGAHGKAEACSDVLVNKGSEMVSGRNIDWPIGNAIQVSLNPRGWYRTAVPLLPGDQPVSWVSQYGSITLGLHFIGAYIHLDGMNEHGLSVGMLMMLDAVYPSPDSRPYLNDDKWPQYYLDNCRTVAEAVAVAPTMRVFCLVGSHLALRDATGDSAVMEYVNGELRIYRPPEDRGVLTNEPNYEEQLANLANYEGFGGNLPLPGGVESESRFVRASWYLQTLPVPESLEETIGSTLAIMQNVAKPLFDREQSCTLSTSIRDHTAKRYYWRSFCQPNLRYVDWMG
jgi:choloylglycine hydrolase